MASKKLKRVATSRSRPRNRPPEMVPPERETPGMSAKHWHRPMTMASFMVNWSKLRSFLPIFSAAIKTKENRMSMAAVIHRLRRAPRIASSNAKPMMPIGMEPTMTIHPMRQSWPREDLSAQPRNQPERICQIIGAKYTSTASSVPSWITAVKDAPASLPQKSSETMRR